MAFDELKDKLLSPPILAYANYQEPFKLHTDASTTGLGAVLYQTQEGVDRVIAYASRSLRNSERRYPAHKLEFLALKWAITEKFHDYLYGGNFDVYTDNNPLTYVLTTAKLDATGQRWLASLSNYNFKMFYRSGRINIDADTLSRLYEESIFPEVLQALSSYHAVSHEDFPLAESLILSQNADFPDTDMETELLSQELGRIDWQVEQSQDPDIARVVALLGKGQRPSAQQAEYESYNVRRYLRDWDLYDLVQGVLFRRATYKNEPVKQLVLPPIYRDVVFKSFHDDAGHQGRDRTLSLLKTRFHWPGLDKEVEHKIKQCDRCVRRKTPQTVSASLVSITSTAPMELVCIDYLSLERSKGGFEHILVITDHFTRYAEASPTKNQTAKTTARVLFDNFIVHYGFPAKLHSNQGQTFGSKIIGELCNMAGVVKSRTTPYHAMGNGMTERFNQTLLKMLGTLEDNEKSDWKSHVPTLVHAYNSTHHDSIGFSPFYLMFGRHPRLAIDAFLGLGEDETVTQTEYARRLRERLAFAYKTASDAASKSSFRHKQNYDIKVRESTLEPGDRVLVRLVGLKGKHKLADKWEHEPYVVLDQPTPGIPVYKVQKETSRGKIRILHRNLLLPFTGLPVALVRSKKSRPEPVIESYPSDSPVSSNASSSESEDERSQNYVTPQRRHNLNPNAMPFVPRRSRRLAAQQSEMNTHTFVVPPEDVIYL